MPGYYGASDQIKLSLVLLISALLAHVIAFGSPYWTTRARIAEWDRQGNVRMERSGGNAGLWTACTEGECYERFNLWAPAWVHWCQALMTSGLVLLLAATVLLFLYMWHRNFDRDRRLVFVGLLACAITSVCTFLTLLIWPAGQNFQAGEFLNWPYVFACVSFLLTSGITWLHLMELRSPMFEHKTPAPTLVRVYTPVTTRKDGSMELLHSKSGSTLLLDRPSKVDLRS